MAHHNPQACETYCCWHCGGVITSNPCGVYWYTTDTGIGRVINESDEVVGTGPQGSVEVPTGTYRLQVQCVTGGDWVTADEVDHVADETLCNCCDIMQPYTSHTIENLDHLTSDCFTLPSTLTIPTFQSYDWTGNVIASECSSSYRIYETYPLLTTVGDVQAAACWTGTYLTIPYWVAPIRNWLTIDVFYSSLPGGGSLAVVRLRIDVYLTEGTVVTFGRLDRRWETGFPCPPERDWTILHQPAYDVSTYPPLVGVTTENLIINTQ